MPLQIIYMNCGGDKMENFIVINNFRTENDEDLIVAFNDKLSIIINRLENENNQLRGE